MSLVEELMADLEDDEEDLEIPEIAREVISSYLSNNVFSGRGAIGLAALNQTLTPRCNP